MIRITQVASVSAEQSAAWPAAAAVASIARDLPQETPHRGHGVGLWPKSATVRSPRARHPSIAEIETDNADGNAHMLAVDERLGFVAHRRTHEYQLTMDNH
ncbi:hypothetical protein AB0B45_10205 [Nonomuraea sp. NPDC049152]|uniref:hypothetical protein n=1 Tax=Nonomuraea sp. NPDC049152 TaxID=3154350 RepID=UPI003406F35D